MKHASLLLLLCLVFLAGTCKKDTIATQLAGKVWLHSFEEDEGQVLTYRPNTFDFPPSRGRTGFALEEDGVIKQYDIAPTDGLEEHIGQWQQTGRKEIQVQLPGNDRPAQSYTLEIVLLKDEVLKLKRVPSPLQQQTE